jgi:hypothetical protein
MDSGSGGSLYVAVLPASNTNGPFLRYRSTDGGKTWTQLGSTGKNNNRYLFIAVDPADDNHVFTADNYALYETTTGGIGNNSTNPPTPAWVDLPGDPGYDWASVSFDGTGNRALLTADQGIFRYCYKLSQYCSAAPALESLNGNLQITQFYTMAVGPPIFVGVAQDHCAMMIDNSGQPSAVWQPLSTPGVCGETGKVLLPPSGANYSYMYNTLSDGNFDLVWRAQVTQPAGLQPTTPWTPIFSQNVYNKGDWNYSLGYTSEHTFVMDPYNPRRLLLGADQVYETTNADYTSPLPTWNPIGPSVPTSVQSSCASGGFCRFVTAIAIAASAPNYVYVATNDDHLWLTTNDGGEWIPCDSNGLYDPGGAIFSMSIDPNNPQHVFAVSSQWWGTSKVWELGSSSGWAQYPCKQQWVNRSGPSNLSVYAIVADWRYSPPHLYIGSDRGVFNSTNLGGSWLRFGSGLPNTQVYDLESGPWSNSPLTNVLVAATYGRGAFAIALPQSSPAPLVVPPKHQPPVWVPPFRPPWLPEERPEVAPQASAPQVK